MWLALLAETGNFSTAYGVIVTLSALGGLSGVAALLMVFVNWKSNQKKAKQDDRSVAITELEKAVPGLSEIIKEWQGVVQRLQKDLADQMTANAVLKKQYEALESRFEVCQRQLDDHLNACVQVQSES